MDRRLSELVFHDMISQLIPQGADSGFRYKNGKVDGPVTGPWCGTTWHFNEALRNPRWEDYDFKYEKRNRFAYLGIGRTRGELTGKGQAAHYLREPGVK